MSPLACMMTEIIPGYTIRERIGAGGYGEVWKADAPGGLAKAIKFIYGCLEGERASRELKALNRIKEVRHPFLLSLERIEVIDGQLVIVTELADASLMNRFEQCVAAGAVGIPRDELLVYLSDAADALDYMRQAFSLQHLDIKPENLLILSGRVKVADFGLVKDIQDTSVSLVGGLTPVYAAPEVFSGHPSLHSDQYSLAIVYQEMLTGVLPFSGRSHAQLVMQHQRNSPRLAPLPPDDQPVIARALARNPEGRFPSCRDLVDQLRNSVGSSKSAGHADLPSSASKGPRGDTSATKTVDTVPHEQQEPKKEDPREADAAKPASTSNPTLSFEGIVLAPGAVIEHLTSELPWPKLGSSAASADHWPLVFTDPAESVKDLPPLDAASGAWRLRPCLVLGLGGTARLVLNGLRLRWSDRFGDLAALPTLQMLLVDSDRSSLAEATHGNPARALKPSETIAMPLRAPEQYHAAPEKYLKWLRRRWLCRIPRSHSTEGLRPLGRLALVDHVPELIGQLKTAISTMISAEAIAASGRQLGQEILPAAPQIILVASISGGTGGGMLLDAAYTVRKVLADLSLSDARLTGVLLHSTGHDPHGKLLARASACACLSELQSFDCGNRYLGDADFGLPAFAAGVPPFDATRVVHLGDGLSQEEFKRATETIGQFLDLATATPGSVFFDSEHQSDATEMTVRTFGLCRIGWTQKEFVAKAADLLCRRTAQHWLGNTHGDNALPLPSLDHYLTQIKNVMEMQVKTNPAVQSLAKQHAAALEEAIRAPLASEGGVLTARAVVQTVLEGLRGMRTDVDERRKRLESLQAQGKLNSLPAATSSQPRPRTWFVLGGSRKRQASETLPSARWNTEMAVLQWAAIMFKNLLNRVVAVAESLRSLECEIEDLVESFVETDDDIATFLDASHPELVSQLDQEWRPGIFGNPSEPLVPLRQHGPTGGDLLDRLREAGRAKVLDALRRDDFRELLPGKRGESPLEPKLLKSCLESAAPHLGTCGGSRRLWLMGVCDALSASLRAAIGLETAQPPSVAIDSHGDFVIGWEIEGLSLSRVAADLIDNQRDAAQLATLLHTRLDIDW
ncbi:MAG: tubulin-like doman-containing protein [Thermoguttaceae bacterium]